MRRPDSVSINYDSFTVFYFVIITASCGNSLKMSINVRIEVVMEAAIKILFLCYVTPYILVEAYSMSEELTASLFTTRSTMLMAR